MSNLLELPEIPTENKILYTYTFEVKFYNETVEVTPIAIYYVHKECDYRNNFNPVYMMTLEVTKTDLFLLKRNQKDLMASISVIVNQYLMLEPGESHGSETTTLLGKEILSSSIFQPLFSQTAFDERYREEEYENKELMLNDNETTVGHETNRVKIDVQFEDLVAVNSKKTPFNFVIQKGVTVGTILQHMFEVLPVKGVIVDMPDNDYAFGTDMIIPPGNLVPVLKYLQYMIGIYENGLLAFYDDDILYILNKYALDHDCEEGDKITTHIYITELDKVLGGITLRGIDPVSGEPVYIGPLIIKPVENEVLSGELDGNNFIFSSFRQGLSAVQYVDNELVSDNVKPVAMTMKRNIETYMHSDEKNMLDYDELGNLYNMASYFNELEASAKQILIEVDNINIKDFKPNKLTHLHFLDQGKDLRLSGLYHIISLTSLFSPVNPSTTPEMNCHGSIHLSRKNTDILNNKR
jgi:hypothetical protein